MKIYLNCTANLGDFLNALPVLSGLCFSYGKIDFIIRKDLEKIKGIKELLGMQEIFSSVRFDTECSPKEEAFILSSWTREDRSNERRPIETCRYENWLRDKYNFKFDVDDEFELTVPKISAEKVTSKILVGDRWSPIEDPKIDTRRKSWVIKDSGKFSGDQYHYLDFSDNIVENAALIKHSSSVFYSTFTGISVVADLLKKDMVVLWDDDIRNWVGREINTTFEYHFYKDRNARLQYIKDV